jgi:hypothetical protein
MTPEGTGGREFSQFVADHILTDIDRHVAPAIVNGNRVTDHLREDG